jgi:deoxyribodipyrimidine photolyase-related protein
VNADGHTALVILGNQLFPRAYVARHRAAQVFMAEDLGLCTYVRHHKQKIVLCLAAMRHHRDELTKAGFRVHYEPLSASPGSYEEKLDRFVRRHQIRRLCLFDVPDQFFERRVREFAGSQRLELDFLPSPMFLTDRPTIDAYFSRQKRPRMAEFYRWQRRRLGLLVDLQGNPRGGRWSFDTENRKALPRGFLVPEPPRAAPTKHVEALVPIVNRLFRTHPGAVSLAAWWLPVTRRQSRAWLADFLEHRLSLFGDYEDAIARAHPVVFHAVLTPALNLGLITPSEVIDETLAAAAARHVPLNALEGFIRQIIGWREFIHGVYRRFGAWEETQNVFGHGRELTDAWYRGQTGIAPLDDVINKAWNRGWVHHIERLMVVANLMNLCEIHPRAAYRWFMEMFVDSSDWVMVPNVFGMGLFADGGLFATKPYIAGSHYLTRMSDYAAAGSVPGGWHDVVDGLFWRFVDRHRARLAGNPRLASILNGYERMDGDRKERIAEAAEGFLRQHTRLTSGHVEATHPSASSSL